MDTAKKIKSIAQDFIKKIAPEANVSILPIKDSTVVIEVKVDDPLSLIGQNCETLLAIQHLLKVILRKNIDQQYYIDLDINNYKKKRKEYLKELAISAANEVSLVKKEKILPPMLAYERRVVHLELQERPDIITESRGEEPDRHIIIKPASR